MSHWVICYSRIRISRLWLMQDHACNKHILYLRPAWLRHQMEIFSAVVAICAENSPITSEFPAQRPVTRSFDVFFDLGLNERLNKQSWGLWFETPSLPLWRQSNGSKAIWMKSDVQPKRRKLLLYLVFTNVPTILLTIMWHAWISTPSIRLVKRYKHNHQINRCQDMTMWLTCSVAQLALVFPALDSYLVNTISAYSMAAKGIRPSAGIQCWLWIWARLLHSMLDQWWRYMHLLVRRHFSKWPTMCREASLNLER